LLYGIALMGYGIVGSGVVEALWTNADHIYSRTGRKPEIKKIFDVFDFAGSPVESLITHDINDIMENDDIELIVETIGGIDHAYRLTKMAFERKKHVVTSNKELVAAHGPELLKIADENNVKYLFEASVGGGIPVIRPLERCLIANEIVEIIGILNGTTNYMLTYMQNFGADFGDTLKRAQERGYAEKDPSADIEGHDAGRKIAILSSIAFGAFADYRDVYTEGITSITLEDIKRAGEIGCVIKLIARARRVDGEYLIAVYPMMIDKQFLLSSVGEVYNGILIRGNIVGDVMLYGRGAGKLPTASAVIADIIDIMRNNTSNTNYSSKWGEKLKIADIDNYYNRYYVRLEANDGEIAVDEALREFPDAIILPDDAESVADTKQVIFTTGVLREREFKLGLQRVENSSSGVKVRNYIRIYTEN